MNAVLAEVLAKNSARRSEGIIADTDDCRRILESGECRTGTRWDAVAGQFITWGFRVERIAYTKDTRDGEGLRWWIYAEAARPQEAED